MTKALRFISISHLTATLILREEFSIPDEEKPKVISRLKNAFPDISGLLLLGTCNRTEIYFESETTSSEELLDFFCSILGMESKRNTHLFIQSNNTLKSVQQLSAVSAGLNSKVLGDAEIIGQIKKAYILSRKAGLQGSLLERALQTVFRAHKRVRNETNFRDGTTSAAYRALKMIESSYGKTSKSTMKILIIGAGEIVKKIFKYNKKFKYQQLFISNRTEENALLLAEQHGCQVYDWEKVMLNDFEDFDVIIGAASNCHHLIKTVNHSKSQRLLIDLGLPGTIDPVLGNNPGIEFFDLDTISSEIAYNKEKRIEAVTEVKEIIQAEVDEFTKWFLEAPLRTLLRNVNIDIKDQRLNISSD
jgi:glutamyl-tRNA reductase